MEWKQFCQSLEMPHWEKAQQLFSELENEGRPQPLLKVNTEELFKKKFSFPELSRNDAVVEIFQELDVSETNLNQNPNNKHLLEKMIKAG